ncbi:MAG: hypothetical protein QM790_20270 [Nibricoccus sp.]
MRFARNIIVIVLAALWLPLTQHCVLEVVGCLDDEHAADAPVCCSEGAAENCLSDSCTLLEEGNYRFADSGLAVVPPALVEDIWCGRVLDLAAGMARAEPSAAGEAVTFERPADCHPIWHFEQRAAQPPRAPSLA